MTFISYAQNYEDVMLNRVFKDIDNGFYIDVGAWSPVLDSVTNAFYQKGWNGINIEPNIKFVSEFSQVRQRDINLCICIGEQEKSTEMYFLRGNGSGMSTLRSDIAHERLSEGWELDKKNILMKPLSLIWSEHVPKSQAVHFLKIDVEGAEKSVLLSMDWVSVSNRPWIILIESTMPMSQVEVHQEWEYLLLQSGYIFAYADGLNRFYIDSSKSDLLDFFKYPPNVFDDFISAPFHLAQDHLRDQKQRLQEVKTLQERAEYKIRILENEIVSKNNMISTILNSRSWRITRPLRFLADNFKKIGKYK